MFGSKTAITIKDQHVQVEYDSSVIANNEDDPSDTFKYELPTYPQDMFESSVLQMVANKASPSDAMWDIVRESQPESVPASNVHYVIYGCALLIGYPGHAMHQGNMDMDEVLLGSKVMLMDRP